MLTAILISLAVVFVAELGDKSQLITMTYALRHRWWVVLSGVGIAVDPGARPIGRHRPLPRPDASRAPDRIRRAPSLPVVRGLDVAGGPRRDDDDVQVAEPRFVRLRRSSRPSSSPNSATRRCSPPSRWPATTTGQASGSAPPRAWCWPTASPSPSARCCTSGCPSSFLHSLASVLFLLFGLWLLFDGALGLRWAAVARHRIGRWWSLGDRRADPLRPAGATQRPPAPASLESSPRTVLNRRLATDDRRDRPRREAVPLTPRHVAVSNVTDLGCRQFAFATSKRRIRY